MKYEITKEQVLAIEKVGGAGVSLYLKKAFSEAFRTELEVNKWYVYGKSLLNYQGLNTKDLIQAYGFLEDKSWMETSNCGNDFKNWKEATPEEVESALINEAKKREYKKGNFKCFVKRENEFNNNYDGWYFEKHQNVLYTAPFGKGGACVFEDGKWATILPQEKTVVPMEKALKIIAKKMKVSPENIEIKN